MKLNQDPMMCRQRHNLDHIKKDCQMLRRNDERITQFVLDGIDTPSTVWDYKPHASGMGMYCIAVFDTNKKLLGYL